MNNSAARALIAAAAFGVTSWCAAARLAQPHESTLEFPPPAAPSALPAPSAVPAADAAASPLPAAGKSPSPPLAPRPLGFHLITDASLTFVSRNAGGPGTLAAEAPAFMSGASPLAPNTPYDLFSSTPQVSGDAGIGLLSSTANYGTAAFDFRLSGALESVRGSVTNAAYLGENLMPTLNPHLGAQALPYAVAFHTHPGEDDSNATRLSILSGSVTTADGRLSLRAGWFDLAQTDRFVFAQPNLTNLNPAIAYAPPETLTSGLAGLDSWQPLSNALPLHGIDLVARHGLATLELTNAALPAPTGQSARLSIASIVLDHGEGTRFSAQVLHATTSGAAFTTTVPFGANPAFTLYPQGVVPTSTLNGQRQTIAGLRGAFHLMPALGLDGIAEAGRAWYDSSLAARPGTAAPGSFYHAGAIETSGHVTGSIDFYRMDPRYATMILPYGIPENTWGVTFAWPGLWPVGNYQLVDNGAVAANRQGYRLRVSLDKTPVELHLECANFRQIAAETVESSLQTGFLDPYFLPQHVESATFGRQRRIGMWVAWHSAFGDITLDLVDDMLDRPFVAAHPEDAVSYQVPQAVLAYARHLSRNIVLSTGYGRFAVKGTYSEPIDFAERLLFAGVEVAQTPRSSLLITYRRSASAGIITFPAQPGSPDYTGTAIIIEQRLRL